MNIFEILNRESGARNLPFLVIGGHAVNACGYARETADVDLLVRKSDRANWQELFESMGYSAYHDAGTFLQLSAPPEGAWPVDLMFVNEETFAKMLARSRVVPHLNTGIRIPDVEHLLALKIHSLKHAGIHRFLKDYQDVIGLIDCGGLDPASKRMKALFEKHGTTDLYEKVLLGLRKD